MSDYSFLPEKHRKLAKVVDQSIDLRFGKNLTVENIDRRLTFLHANRETAIQKQAYFSKVVMRILVPYGIVVVVAFYGAGWLGLLNFLSPLQRGLLHLALGLPVILGAGVPMFFWRRNVPGINALETECLLLNHYKAVRQR